MISKPLHVLVSPLDWGLGHAARCIPVINELAAEGHKISIAGHGRSLIMLKKEFPLLDCIELKGFSPSYPAGSNMVLHLLLRLPWFLFMLIHEHYQLKKLIATHKFDVIISDNRYGLWNAKTYNIIITHQIMIKVPDWLSFAEYFLYGVSRLFINRFDACWIPDGAHAPGLSGDLSHKYDLSKKCIFIGPLSRFTCSETATDTVVKNKIVAIISGPEPQRSIFESLLARQLTELNLPAIVVGGKPEAVKVLVSTAHLTVLPYLQSDELQLIIRSAALVICRSGYSSIMDLQAIGAKALLVPTPGQTEQIYLAKLHAEAGTVLYRLQKDLNLETDMAEALKFPGFVPRSSVKSLKQAISGIKKK